jgi:prevent-host-death family protein
MVQRSLPILTVSDLRTKVKEALAHAQKQPLIITQRGRPRGVLLSYETFQRLVDASDAVDRVLIERALATATEFVSFDEMLAHYSESSGISVALEEIASAE